jgi:hypothetical protein
MNDVSQPVQTPHTDVQYEKKLGARLISSIAPGREEEKAHCTDSTQTYAKNFKTKDA